MNSIKKYVPLIAILLVVFGVLLIIFIPKSNEFDIDTDKDGVKDKVDLCDTVPGLATNNGCPGVIINEKDFDLDGVGKNSDPDDRNPCVPNINCELCDLDSDGWNLKKEKIVGSDPKKKDTDNDGINDPTDNCPLKKGILANNGCPVDSDRDGVMDDADRCPEIGKSNSDFALFDRKGCPIVDFKLSKTTNSNIVSWDLNGYEGTLKITLSYLEDDGYKIVRNENVSGSSSYEFKNLPSKINGRTLKVTLQTDSESADFTFINSSKSFEGFKCNN